MLNEYELRRAWFVEILMRKWVDVHKLLYHLINQMQKQNQCQKKFLENLRFVLSILLIIVFQRHTDDYLWLIQIVYESQAHLEKVECKNDENDSTWNANANQNSLQNELIIVGPVLVFIQHKCNIGSAEKDYE